MCISLFSLHSNWIGLSLSKILIRRSSDVASPCFLTRGTYVMRPFMSISSNSQGRHQGTSVGEVGNNHESVNSLFIGFYFDKHDTICYRINIT